MMNKLQLLVLVGLCFCGRSLLLLLHLLQEFHVLIILFLLLHHLSHSRHARLLQRFCLSLVGEFVLVELHALHMSPQRSYHHRMIISFRNDSGTESKIKQSLLENQEEECVHSHEHVAHHKHGEAQKQREGRAKFEGVPKEIPVGTRQLAVLVYDL